MLVGIGWVGGPEPTVEEQSSWVQSMKVVELGLWLEDTRNPWLA